MHVAIVYKVRPDRRDAAIGRLLETGGLPPEGARMLQRWHDLASTWGVTITETDDPLAIPKWCLQWNDVLEFEVHQVIADEQAVPLLSALRAK